ERRKNYSRDDQVAGYSKAERQLAEGSKVHRSGADAVHRQCKQAPDHSAYKSYDHRLDDERQQNAAPRKTQTAKRSCLASPMRHRGVHRIHAAKAGANPHHDRYEHAKHLHRLRGGGLFFVILLLGFCLELQSLLAFDSICELIARADVLGARQNRRKLSAVKRVGDYVRVRPDLRIECRASGVKETDDRPIDPAKMNRLSESGTGESFGDFSAHYRFADAGLKHSAVDEF